MNLKEIYVDKKREIDNGYMEMYNTIKDAIESDDEYTLADDELDELVVDLMISSVMGEVIQWNKVEKLLKNNKK